MTSGIISNYYSLLKHLKKEQEKFAFLQLAGRMGDMLVKEFAYRIWLESRGSRFPVTNAANRGEQKFDIVVLRGRLRGTKGDSNCEVCALIEAKYLQRRHRAWEFNANDETRASLEGLRRQLGKFNSNRHYGFPVKLQARSKQIYGLVIASYVSAVPSTESNGGREKEEFFKHARQAAKGFRYLDKPDPLFDRIYDDVEVSLMGGKRYCTLRAGLWRMA